MKQQLISGANTALLCILLVIVIVSELTRVKLPQAKPHKDEPELAVNLDRFSRAALPVSQISGKRNIFGFNDPKPATPSADFQVIKPPTLSELKIPAKSPLSQQQIKPNVIEPLSISLNGIIASKNEENNSCIIANSSNQEKMYRVGEQVQDGTIIDITTTSVAIIRPNGQIETFKIVDPKAFKQGDDLLKSAINKLDDKKFTIDHLLLSQQVSSLGQFIEETGLLPQYEKGLLKGFLVTKAEDNSLAKALGLNKNDLVISIFNSTLDTAASRISVYDKFLAATYGTDFNVALKRNNQEITINYRFDKKAVKNKSLAEYLDSKEVAGAKGPDKGQGQSEDKANKFNNPAIIIKPMEEKSNYIDKIQAIRERLLENANRQRFTQPR